MQVHRRHPVDSSELSCTLYDDAGEPVAVVTAFLNHLAARGYSPNTHAAYAYDLLHFYEFLARTHLSIEEFTPPQAVALLDYLRGVPSRRPAQRLGLTLCTSDAGQPARRLAATTINRILAAVSSFYEYLIIAGRLPAQDNPLQQVEDLATARVSARHQPLLGRASRQRPIRRAVRVKTIQRVPRPLSEDQVRQLVGSLRCWRDKALVYLMLQGGLRPGEVLNVHLEDIQYGQRRVVVRYRTDHPKGVRTKSRRERVVDLHEPEALSTVSAYVLQERPPESPYPHIFLVGGHGTRRCDPLGYAAVVKLFARRCDRLGIRAPWLTPHALRHTHATRMWEGGMRELTLQQRLGHASPDSTRLYTRVSDPVVVAEYRRVLGEEVTP
jgi:integrase